MRSPSEIADRLEGIPGLEHTRSELYRLSGEITERVVWAGKVLNHRAEEGLEDPEAIRDLLDWVYDQRSYR